MKSNRTPVPRKAENRSLLRNSMCFAFWRAAFRRATRRALSETSTAWMRARGSSLARAMAMQPLPVPTSRMDSLSRRRELEDLFDQAFGLGPRHEHRRRHLERDGPELLRPGEMGERHAVQPPRDEAPEEGLGLRRARPRRRGQVALFGQAGRPEQEDLGFENGLGPVAEKGDPVAEELDEGRVSFQRPWPGRRRARSRRAPRLGPGGRDGPGSRRGPRPGRPRCCGSSRSAGGR